MRGAVAQLGYLEELQDVYGLVDLAAEEAVLQVEEEDLPAGADEVAEIIGWQDWRLGGGRRGRGSKADPRLMLLLRIGYPSNGLKKNYRG